MIQRGRMQYCEAVCLSGRFDGPCESRLCLVTAARDGDTAAREQLFALLAPLVLQQARRICGAGGAAQDVAQLAMLHVLEHLADLRQPDRLAAWVRRIVTNTYRMEERSRALRQETQPVESATPVVACEGERRLDAQRMLRRVLRNAPELPPLLAETFRLRVVEGLNTRQAAAVLGISPEAVRARLKRARERLRAGGRRASG